MELNEKLRILSDAAKYDVSCSSSCSKRSTKKGDLGSVAAAGICHSFSPDGRCISLLKILLSNCCIYDCSYCINRKSNDVERATFTPDEIVNLTINFYRRNYIEGLFLSSAIVKNPDFTMELMLNVVRKLRIQYKFKGYIHLKAIPGADKELIRQAGLYADRMSVNLELPSAQSLKLLAPDKTKHDILAPMNNIKNDILINKEERKKYRNSPVFVPGGQSTQLIVGATKENDLSILNLSENLYNRFDLKRVYYSAYVPVNRGGNLPDLKNPPTLREHRLYQGDWLLRKYGFRASELLNDKSPNFDINFDPKTTYALNNFDEFPIEINRASYETLIRIPGIGLIGARKIVSARRISFLEFEDLKKLGVVLKRAQYFITCRGKYYGSVDFDDEKIKKALMPKVDLNIIDNEGVQLSFFDNASESNDIIKKNDNEISKLLLNMDSDNSTNDILLPDKKILLLDDKSTAITGEL
ncbi:MAG: putative DNA modification/repair radical SAM protein [Inconstantimicrobium porci]|uniref:putative DNA modification/repair radical SAM protein n=1 Tax=Inconstantimicrobium porci TaxID=2652291 RepID=UPI002A91123C|nr:putative DNA modification/repair radical SAM protein [Inconstantimicrobium porci]MDY5913381.1 putative DNA modification/repair radical SAM protein [Inconstantimicrobium porci]